MSLKTPKPH